MDRKLFKSLLKNITDQEFRILTMIKSGMPLYEIAEENGLSRKGFKGWHMNRLYKKLGITARSNKRPQLQAMLCDCKEIK